MKRICFYILFGWPVVSMGQSTAVLTLESALATALQNNYEILLARTDSASLAIDRSFSLAAFVPRLNMTGSRIWNINAQKQELSNGSKRDTSGLQSNNIIAGMNLNWTLFDGFKMFATRKRVVELEQLSGLALKAQIITTAAEVTQNYFNIVREKQQLMAINEQISINEERVKLAEKKLKVGLGAKPELLQARLDLNEQRSNRLRELTLIDQLKQTLNQLMAVAISSSYEVTDSIPINFSLQLGELQSSLAKTNPSLLQAAKSIRIAELSLRERRGELLPIISFNSAYNFNRLQNLAVINTFTPLFNQNKGFNYGFGVSLPILNNLNTQRLIQKAKIDIDFQRLAYRNILSQTDLALSNAFKSYEMQKQALQLEEENITLAKENVNISFEQFRQGVTTFIQLRTAQITLAEAYNRLIAARYNTKLAEIELLRLKGEILK